MIYNTLSKRFPLAKILNLANSYPCPKCVVLKMIVSYFFSHDIALYIYLADPISIDKACQYDFIGINSELYNWYSVGSTGEEELCQVYEERSRQISKRGHSMLQEDRLRQMHAGRRSKQVRDQDYHRPQT